MNKYNCKKFSKNAGINIQAIVSADVSIPQLFSYDTITNQCVHVINLPSYVINDD